jgi:hypothetical protein
MDILSKIKINFPGIKLPALNLPQKLVDDQTLLEEETELKNAINHTLSELECARLNFDYADAPEMVEYYTYKMKACEAKYQYFIKQIKLVREE